VETGFIFTTEREVLTINKTSGQFPPYERILPPDYKTSFTIDAEALLASLNRLAPLTDDENPVVVFNLTDGATVLRLTAANAAANSTGTDSAEDEVDLVAPVAGSTVAFALKYTLLSDYLTRTKGGIFVKATDGTKLVDFLSESGAYRFLQMPQVVTKLL
jgi:DNA polymerase-3 subunit beta